MGGKKSTDEMAVYILGVELSIQKHLWWPCMAMFHDEKGK